jgi:ketosteroid isomerase-like protein
MNAFFFVHAQKQEQEILNINYQIDQAVVLKDLDFLKKHYADDFVFTHGTGYVEGKESWLKDVASQSTKFISRIQDSTSVEMHGDIALVTGKVDIKRQGKDNVVTYGIWYIRIYRLNQSTWQMISHRTTKEWHN